MLIGLGQYEEIFGGYGESDKVYESKCSQREVFIMQIHNGGSKRHTNVEIREARNEVFGGGLKTGG